MPAVAPRKIGVFVCLSTGTLATALLTIGCSDLPASCGSDSYEEIPPPENIEYRKILDIVIILLATFGQA